MQQFPVDSGCRGMLYSNCTKTHSTVNTRVEGGAQCLASITEMAVQFMSRL